MNVLRHALYSTLRLIARHVEGFFTALAAFLSVGFMVAAAAISIFAAIASAVRANLTQAMDASVLRWFAMHRSPLLDQVMLEITALGTSGVLIVVVLIAMAFLWQTQHKWSVYALFVGVFGGSVLNTALKMYFHRPRPTVVEWGTTVHTASFPSGHAMESLITYGCIAYLVGRVGPEPRLQKTIWGVAAALIVAIGISRMYLGVHYPSDVVAGYIAGLGWLTFVVATIHAIRYFASRRPETRHEEHDLQR